jgi:isopentenyl-diphosphate Delta-isomerase
MMESIQASGITMRQVILCDESGSPTGTADLLEAHKGKGQLHVAFSVYVFSKDGRSLLIQQRSAEKMLWPLAWANTCCSHPRQEETPVEAGRRRLQEEMGFECELRLGPGFVYRAEDPSGRGVEHEYDWLLVGTSDAMPNSNPSEVAEWRWVSLNELREDMNRFPDRYAPWLHLGLPLAVQSWKRDGK